ncbi:MAG: ParB/RepB/Spo0J family partition protein [Desulfobacterales bacterium]
MGSETRVAAFASVSVPLEAVEADDRFRISTGDDAADLAASIARIGLLHPPLVVRREGRIILISGFRRFAACRTLGWRNLPVRLPEKEPSPRECARLAVAENAWSRPLNLIEQSRAVGLLAAFSPGGKIDIAEARAAGLRGSEDFLNRIAPLCRTPEAVQEAILEESISFWTACELAAMPAGEAEALALLFRRLKAGLNVQREILTRLREIALREGISIASVLESPAVQELRDDGGSDPNEKTRALRELLRRRRYPFLSAAEDRFRALLRELPSAPGLRLQPPRDFEGKRFSLQLEFETPEEACSLREKLDALLGHPVFRTLFEGKSRGYEADPPSCP